ncbi:MAG: ABC transporter ATP-binding protein [Planctomycetota bacterium]|nr:MAG: ABC transporter ATP-binding protein [Planctomycetota bacterium]
MTEPVLRFRGVTKVFPAGRNSVRALDGFDYALSPGGIVGLVGPDGAGKSTLLRLATALLLPSQGRIEVLGHDTQEEPLAVQAAVGYMPQRFGLYEDLSVEENLNLYADLQGVPPHVREARYAELMRMTGLSPFLGRLAGRLSGGMKQKLGLACALIRSPALLLLDEPTVGVDPLSRRELWAIVERMVREGNTTVLLSTAYMDEAERCDEVLFLHEGRLLERGAPRDLASQAAGAAFLIDPGQEDRKSLQARLQASERVVDAIPVGERIRVVLDRPGLPDPTELPALHGAGEPQPVPPRLEDAFVLRLRAARTPLQMPPLPQRGTPRDEEEVIVVEDARRRFGSFWAVKGIDFTVRRGEIFGLLGANGAGKSTTFRMLCGLLPASSGRLTVAGYDLRRAAATARGRLGTMAQRFSLYEHLTVLQNLRFFASAYRLTGSRLRERIAWALDGFELRAVADVRSGQLSLGYKQRLALAVALMHEPEILFLDEPTSGVDALARREFWRRINQLAATGVTVLVTTHFMEEASYCDRLVIMADGEVLASGSPSELLERVRSETLPEPTMEDAFIALVGRPRGHVA